MFMKFSTLLKNYMVGNNPKKKGFRERGEGEDRREKKVLDALNFQEKIFLSERSLSECVGAEEGVFLSLEKKSNSR